MCDKGINIKNGIICHINNLTFAEDPLRALQAAQFAARFNYTISDETVELCRQMDISDIPKESIMGELEKALLKAEKPSVFFETLRQMDKLSVWFPELEQTIGIKQNPKYHAEGDVWTHTMMVADAAIKYRDRVKRPLGFMLSAITHDFGKALCTEIINGSLHAYNHETIGLPRVEAFMTRLTTEEALIEYVMNLSKYHMQPNVMAADHSSVKATNKMFDQSAEPEALVYLAICDELGKTSAVEYVSNDDFLNKRLELFKEYMGRPYVMERDLIASGLTPSERFTDYLEYAHKLRLAGVQKDNALRQVLALARKREDHARTAQERT